jgi:hypothetical protein
MTPDTETKADASVGLRLKGGRSLPVLVSDPSRAASSGTVLRYLRELVYLFDATRNRATFDDLIGSGRLGPGRDAALRGRQGFYLVVSAAAASKLLTAEVQDARPHPKRPARHLSRPAVSWSRYSQALAPASGRPCVGRPPSDAAPPPPGVGLPCFAEHREIAK